MNRRHFLRTLASAVPAASFMPYYEALAATERNQVRITDVKVMRVQIHKHAMPLVKIETDAGIFGIGECHHDVTGLGAKDVVLNAFRRTLIGSDPFDIDRLIQEMTFRVSYLGGNGGIAMHALTGCEIALWDLTGKLLDMPVRKILGGGAYRNRVRAYLTGPVRNMLDKAACREWADYVMNASVQKWTGAKVDHISRRPGGSALNRRFDRTDIAQNVKAFENLREAVGEDFEIAFHCHWEFDLADSLRLARAIEHIGIWWLEDPMPVEFNESWVTLTQNSPVPILCGENLYTRHDFRPFIVNQGVHMIEIDISMAGGLLEAKKIADLAEMYYMPVCTHNVMGPLATIASANCAATIMDFVGHESFDFKQGMLAGEEDLIIYDREIIQDGYIQLSDNPGFGVEINKDVAMKYLLDGEEWWGDA